MPYVPITFRLPRPIDQPIGFESLPLRIMERLLDAALALELFESARGNGLIPSDPTEADRWMRAQRLHALGFVDALAGARRCVKTWAKLTGRVAAIEAADRIDELIPGLEELRDSIEHEDERAQWKKKKGHIEIEYINVTDETNGVVHVFALFTPVHVVHRRLVATGESGQAVGVDIWHWPLIHARTVCQETFDAVPNLPVEEITL